MSAFKRNLTSTIIATLLVACSVDIPTGKGGGRKGSEAAEEGQKSGSNATSHQDQAQEQGNEVDEIVCDAENEGVGWCDDDVSVVFCASETWWRLDCTALDPASYCDYDDDDNVVDCFVDVEEEEGE
ncbi:MAG TPA: hypothetical protein VFB62_28090 [Polyangiaceae bacterium]|jgi:hypothetical protein|nr:hypothetical protein [Polyangiaceae bacterium]